MLKNIGGSTLVFLESTGKITLLTIKTIRSIPKVRLAEVFRQMVKLGIDSLPIVLLTIMFTGMVLAIQTSKEFVRFGAGASVGGVVAIAMGRELVPVLAGVVVAGRVGAAIAAEIGSMKVTEQIDALIVMATDPIAYLVLPRFLAIVLMLPLLIILGNAIGSFGGYVVATNYVDISSENYIKSIQAFVAPFDILGGMIKGLFFGGIVAIIGCYKGMGAKQGAEGVGVATTASVVLSIILIFIFNYVLSFLLFVY